MATVLYLKYSIKYVASIRRIICNYLLKVKPERLKIASLKGPRNVFSFLSKKVTELKICKIFKIFP